MAWWKGEQRSRRRDSEERAGMRERERSGGCWTLECWTSQVRRRESEDEKQENGERKGAVTKWTKEYRIQGGIKGWEKGDGNEHMKAGNNEAPPSGR
eukprot:5064456-Pleurochrysis_carterae.AAC.1